jgi:hypothetical protein
LFCLSCSEIVHNAKNTQFERICANRHKYTHKATKRATGHYSGIVGDLRDIVPRQPDRITAAIAPTARQDHAWQYRARKSDSDSPTLRESPRQSRESRPKVESRKSRF